jgi:hypothetical protein
MKTYNCEYEKGHTLTKELELPDNWWQKKIEANSPTEAYEKFLDLVGSYPFAVKISAGFLSASKEFKSHIKSAGEELKKIRQQKKKTLPKQEVSTEVQIKDFIEQQSGETLTMEQILMNLLRTQQVQVEELKKVNFKLMMFWIILVVIPIVLSMMR